MQDGRMNIMESKRYEKGKKVKIILTNNWHYNGVIINSDEDTLTIRDRFGKEVCVSKKSMMVFEEDQDQTEKGYVINKCKK